MKDRIVEFPNRYKLVPVSGTTDQYDFVPMPGTITEEGTPYSKGNFLTDDTAALYDVQTPNEALQVLGERPPVFGAYASDFYMYITGKHPILNAGPYSDYDRTTSRAISISGNAETIYVYDDMRRAR